jgi:hypothetical protein
MVACELARTILPLSTLIPVVVLQDVKTSMKGSSGELVLRKGAKLELPLGVALPLIERGVVKVDQESLPPLREMSKIRWVESRDPNTVQKLDEDFYVKARLLIMLMESEGKDQRAVESAKAMLLDIVRLRLQKILKAVTANPEMNRDFAEKLTIEERALYATLCRSVKMWYSSMVEFVERGDPLGGERRGS